MADKTMELKVIAPERVFYEGNIQFVEFNTTEGVLGIYPEHIPMTTVISPGVLIIKEDQDTKEAALLSGFVEILGNKITILAEAVEWPEEIDEKRANEAKIRAERRINEDSKDAHRAELALRRSIVRLETINFK